MRLMKPSHMCWRRSLSKKTRIRSRGPCIGLGVSSSLPWLQCTERKYKYFQCFSVMYTEEDEEYSRDACKNSSLQKEGSEASWFFKWKTASSRHSRKYKVEKLKCEKKGHMDPHPHRVLSLGWSNNHDLHRGRSKKKKRQFLVMRSHCPLDMAVPPAITTLTY